MSRLTNRPALTAAGAALVIAAGVTVAVTASLRPAVTTAVASALGRPAPHRPAGGGSAPHRSAGGGSAHAVSLRRPAGPLRVTSVTQGPWAGGPSGPSGVHGVNGAADVRVTFSAPLAAGSPLPRLSPAIPGTWARSGQVATFTPAAGFPARTRVTVTVPGGAGGVKGPGGATLAARYTARYITGGYSTLRLQQILAQLGYLPVTWAPVLGDAVPPDANAELSAAYRPPQGAFTWHGDYPAALTAQWRPGSANLIDTGAIMAFQADHGLAMDGAASPSLWSALLRAATADQVSTHGYTYALASKASPETLTIWHDGRRVFRSLANTGIAAAPTADGTYPVYERLRYQVMTGTNPDGTPYADPVEYVAYFNGGDAVHYFPRYSYGFPQSLGCVELPLGPAATAWSYLSYGSLVTVS